jgi:hypothetical protein
MSIAYHVIAQVQVSAPGRTPPRYSAPVTTPPPGYYGPQQGQWGQPQGPGDYGRQQGQWGQPQEPGGYGPRQGHWGQSQQPGSHGGHGQYWQYPPPPPPPKKNGVLVAIVVIAVLVLGGAGAAIYLLVKDEGDPQASTGQQTSGTATTSRAPETTESSSAPRGDGPAAGACIKVITASETDAEIDEVNCADQEAVYRIGKELSSSTGTCPDGDYAEYTETGSNSLKLCLILNAKEGDCFKEGDQHDTRTNCPAADYKVAKVIDGKADADQCGADDAENALTYSEPPTTLCRVTP